MSWPTPADFNEAIQNPDLSFEDPVLAGGRPENDATGVPRAYSGAIADVYCLHCGGERVAVKCFTRPIAATMERRYQEVHNVLGRLKLPFTVDFAYRPRGIWVCEQWYPLVQMQWVDGILLNEFARSMAKRPEVLDGMIRILLRVGDRLSEHEVCHGDLQHGNILLIPSEDGRRLAVRLVDYDGVWVPALRGEPPSEFGHPDYQHPHRQASGYYGPASDRFSLLAIATGLRATMSHGPGLWDRFDNAKNILFTRQDYLDPHRSELFGELSRSTDETVRRLCGALGNACLGPLDQTPVVSAVLATRPVAVGEAVPELGRDPIPTGQEPSLEPEWEDIISPDAAAGGAPDGASRGAARYSPRGSARLAVWGLAAAALGVGLVVAVGVWVVQSVKEQPATQAEVVPEEEPPPKAPKAATLSAIGEHDKALNEADGKLSERFRDVIRTLNDGNDPLAAVVRAERERYAAKRLIPWSKSMWQATQTYIQAVQSADQRLIASAEAAPLRLRSDKVAEAKQVSRGANVVARWRHQAGKGAFGVIVLYANGKIGSPNGPATWVLRANNTLVLNWPGARIPGGVFVDRCQVTVDGKTYRGSNQQGVPISGHYVDE